jgi:elongation factor P--(R)-beta-lysine ligase
VAFRERGRTGVDPIWLQIHDGRAPVRSRILRARVYDSIRQFFRSQGFLEVETPLLVRNPGMEPHLEVFQTELRAGRRGSQTGYLTTSPEYAMKKLLVAGIAPIFQICKSFRNDEETSARHNPEFSMLEWYRLDADYRNLMEDCEKLFGAIVDAGCGDIRDSRLSYQGARIDLTPPWERVSVREAFVRYADVDLEDAWERESLAEVAISKGYRVEDDTTWEQLYHQIFLNEIESKLGRTRPTILYDYPASMAALARLRADDPRVAERFELYVGGIELANAFSELTDPDEQRRRLESDRRERRNLGKTDYEIDRDFIRALEVGLPRAAGIALGLDRLIMLFADVTSIRDVMWFPADEIFP